MSHSLKRSRVLSVCLVTAIIAFMVCSCFAPATQAMSAITSNLSDAGFDRNQGKYAHIGSYYIYAFENKLVFYSSSAVLVKTWSVDYNTTLKLASNSGGSNAVTATDQSDFSITILDYGASDTVFVGLSYFAKASHPSDYGYDATVFEYWFLNVNNLAVSAHGDNSVAGCVDASVFGHQLSYGDSLTSEGVSSDIISYFDADNVVIHAVAGSKTSVNCNYLFNINDIGIVSNYTDTGNDRLYGSSIYQIDFDAAGFAYILTRNAVDGDKAYLFVSGYNILNYIGVTGLDDTYGTYWNYFGGYSGHVVDGDYVYDFLVGFGYYEGSTKALKLELIRYNGDSEAFDVIASTATSIDSLGDFPRVLSIGSQSLLTFDGLTDGTYGAVYYAASGNSGILSQQMFTISDLNTTTPTIATVGNPFGTYQGIIVNFASSGGFAQSYNYGGLIDPWATVGLIIDYGTDPETNGGCAAELFTPLSSTISHNFVISPAPLYISSDNSTIQLAANTLYSYTGYVSVNGIGGTGYVYVSGLGEIRAPGAAGQNLEYVGLNNGVFSFNIQTGSVSADTTLGINVTLTNFSGSLQWEYRVISLQSGSGGGGGATATPNPNGTTNPIIPDDSFLTNPAFLTFIMLFLLIGGPAFILGCIAGMPGIMVGGILGLGIGILAGLIPFWFIFLVGLGLVFAIYTWQGKNKQSAT